MNRILRATSKNQEVLAFVADTKELVNKAVSLHQTMPPASAALGRLLTAGAMMGLTLKGDKDLLTLTVKGDGPLGSVLVTADSKGKVKGYVSHPQVELDRKENGKIDVSGAVGKGTLTVVKDLGLKEPYVGHIELVSGEIADDLTYYFAASEQIPSVVALGVLVDVDYTIRQSGGFIVQLMPGASEETIKTIEENIHQIDSVTDMFEQGMTPEMILEKVLRNLEPKIHEESQPEYRCNCSKDRVEKALISVGAKELHEMIQENEPIEMNCHFCGKKYTFSIETLKDLLEKAK